MSEFLKMDVFFFVATLAVVLVAVALLLAIIRVWQILGIAKRLGEQIESEAKLIRADVSELRASVRREGLKVHTLYTAAGQWLQHIFRRRRR